MQALLLTARPELAVNQRLVSAAGSRGIELGIAHACRVNAAAGVQPALWLGSRNLLASRPAFVIARIGNWRPESLLATLEACTDAGVATPSPAAAIRSSRDHWQTARQLAAAGLPVPQTIAGADAEELAATALARLGLPVVVKQRRSRMGVGVIRCTARDQLEAVLDSLWRVGDEVVVQRFIETGGSSLRLLVVGDRVVAAARFTAAAGDWRSNAARGGGVEEHQPDQAEQQLAVAAARRLGLGICGVDLLEGGHETLVCEVNPTPGFRHLESATGADVAGAIIDYAAGLSEMRQGSNAGG